MAHNGGYDEGELESERWGDGGGGSPEDWQRREDYKSKKHSKKRGYLDQMPGDYESYLRMLSGQGEVTDPRLRELLESEKGEESRFISRMMYNQYINDPRVQAYQRELQKMARGGLESKLRGVSQEAIGRGGAAARFGEQTGLDARLGGGMSAPGMTQYINRKMDSALTGELGEAYRQAALQDISSRLTASGELRGMADRESALLQNIGQVSANSSQWNQNLTSQTNPWQAMGMQVLGQGIGGLAGAATGGMGTALGGMVGGGMMGMNPQDYLRILYGNNGP